MKNKSIIIFLLCFFLQGCSLVKTLVAPFKPTVSSLPQQTEKSKAKNICKGETKFNEQGEMIYCSRGYYIYEESFGQKERRLTIKEKVIQFFDKLIGWSFWIVIGLVILCPSALGFIAGRIIESIVGIGKKALVSTVRAVQKARKDEKDLNQALDTEQDADVKKYIVKIKEQEKIK